MYREIKQTLKYPSIHLRTTDGMSIGAQFSGDRHAMSSENLEKLQQIEYRKAKIFNIFTRHRMSITRELPPASTSVPI